jgi:hypothetical protein
LLARLAERVLKDGGRDFEILLQTIAEKESEVDRLAKIADRESMFVLAGFEFLFLSL